MSMSGFKKKEKKTLVHIIEPVPEDVLKINVIKTRTVRRVVTDIISTPVWGTASPDAASMRRQTGVADTFAGLTFSTAPAWMSTWTHHRNMYRPNSRYAKRFKKKEIYINYTTLLHIHQRVRAVCVCARAPVCVCVSQSRWSDCSLLKRLKNG